DDAAAHSVPVLSAMLQRGDHRILQPDPAGGFRFHPGLRNEYELAAALDRIVAESGPLNGDRDAIRALYEATFHHRAFTGRSGTMFAYEGLGCIYWHMVSKLMLAAQEVAVKVTGDDPLSARLAAA